MKQDKWQDLYICSGEFAISSSGRDFVPGNVILISLWCNGSTSDSGSEDRGSNPCKRTKNLKFSFASGLLNSSHKGFLQFNH